MKKIILMLTLLLIFSCSNGINPLEKELMIAIEASYMEGQIDALSGDVIVEKLSDGDWKWASSPYAETSMSEREPIYRKWSGYQDKYGMKD